MKYYKQLLNLQCFTRADVERLTGNIGTANSLMDHYQKKGYISSIKRNLHAAISMETGQAVANRYFIASHITKGSYLTHHAAFEYYGCANQVYYEIYVSGGKRFAEFEYDGITYRYIAPRINDGVVENPNGIRVTNVERTTLDSINDFEKISGLEEVLRCLEIMPDVDENKLLDYLEQYDKQILYQKVGYILGHLKKELQLSEAFFNACERRVQKSIRYLYRGIEYEQNIFDKRWQLFVPQNLMKILYQGGEQYGDL